MQEVTLTNTSFIRSSFKFARQCVRFCWKIFLQALLLFVTAIGWFLVNLCSPEGIDAAMRDSEMRAAAEEEEERKQFLRKSYDHQYLNKPFHRKHR